MKTDLPSDLAQLLGGMSPASFLRGWWHKKPLLIRRALPGFKPLISKTQLFELAKQDEVESRLVSRIARTWDMITGPMTNRDFRRAPEERWSLLVQGVNLHVPAADALLRRFSFLPYARLDDLMVSWANDGGGVGPHFDSYDVFLLQAAGKRRWRLSPQSDRTLVEGAPLKILRRFRPKLEYLLEPGDMLYLPPGWAHDGVAEGECMTYSIGFRAPSAQELARGLYEHAAETVVRQGFYADPRLQPTQHPGRIDKDYVDQAIKLIGTFQPTRSMIESYLGTTLTEPKANVWFDAPDQPLRAPVFAGAARRRGIALDRRTQMLYCGRQLFINGEACAKPSDVLRKLADTRHLPADTELSASDLAALHAWHGFGWLHLGEVT